MMIYENCRTCKFWTKGITKPDDSMTYDLAKDLTYGKCHRFPKEEPTRPLYVCGEYQK